MVGGIFNIFVLDQLSMMNAQGLRQCYIAISVFGNLQCIVFFKITILPAVLQHKLCQVFALPTITIRHFLGRTCYTSCVLMAIFELISNLGVFRTISHWHEFDMSLYFMWCCQHKCIACNHVNDFWNSLLLARLDHSVLASTTKYHDLFEENISWYQYISQL